MAKPNYAFEKRQRELAKKQKKEEKAARKAQQKSHGEGEADPEAQSDTLDAAEAAASPEAARPDPAAPH